MALKVSVLIAAVASLAVPSARAGAEDASEDAYGFTPELYRQWDTFIREWGGIEHASTWLKAGFNHDQAWGFRVFLGFPLAKAIEIRDGACHGRAPEPHELIGDDVYEVNPFDATGKCFFVDGTILQLLDRSVSLASPNIVVAGMGPDPRQTVKIDFSPSSSPPEGKPFKVIAIGTQPFRYTSTRGEQRTVPNLSVVAIETPEQ